MMLRWAQRFGSWHWMLIEGAGVVGWSVQEC